MEDLNKLAIEIEAEKKSLNEVVETIGIFVNRYKDLKELLNGFVETNKYDLSDDFAKIKNTTKEISDNLDNVKKSLSTLKLDFTPTILNVITDKNYNVKNPPLLVINDNVISEGKVLTEREISKYIKEYAI